MFREKHLKKKNSGLVFFLYFNLKRRQCSVKGGPVVKKNKTKATSHKTRRWNKKKKKNTNGVSKIFFQCDDDGDVFFFSTYFLASFWRGTTRDICIAITPLNTSKSPLMYGMYLYKFIAFYMYRYIFFYFMSQKTLNERNEPECRQWDKKAAERKLMFVFCCCCCCVCLVNKLSRCKSCLRYIYSGQRCRSHSSLYLFGIALLESDDEVNKYFHLADAQ